MGARLGAATVIRAAAQNVSPAPDLVLWDPVVNGAAYTQMLRQKHLEALEASFGLPRPADWRRFRDYPSSFRDQAIGIAVSPRLREQLSMLGPVSSSEDEFDNSQLDVPMAARTTVIADAADELVRQWCERQQSRGAALIYTEFESALEWTSDDSLNAALVPPDAVKQLLLAIDR